MNALATVAPAEAGLPRFAGFVAAFSSLVAEQPAEHGLLARGGQLLAALLCHDDWLPDAYAAPDPVRYRQYLLHRDPAARFSVVSFVWGPGQATPVHDHRTWGLIGVLRGAELAEAFTFDAEGALRSTGPAQRLEAGAIDSVSPRIGDVHRVANAHDDRVSISIHIYGGDIGAIERATYDRNGQPKRFVSGYADLPALIDQLIPPRNGEGDHAQHGGGAGARLDASDEAPAPPPPFGRSPSPFRGGLETPAKFPHP